MNGVIRAYCKLSGQGIVECDTTGKFLAFYHQNKGFEKGQKVVFDLSPVRPNRATIRGVK